MANLSDNNLAYLKSAAKGETVVPALVYSKLSSLGLVAKVEGKSAGRGKTIVVATPKGKQEIGG